MTEEEGDYLCLAEAIHMYTKKPVACDSQGRLGPADLQGGRAVKRGAQVLWFNSMKPEVGGRQ